MEYNQLRTYKYFHFSATLRELAAKNKHQEKRTLDKDIELRMQRMEAVNEIQNLVATYECYHTASMQEECVALFAQKTPGVRVSYDMVGHWDGIEGIRRYFIGFLGAAESDLTGRIYQHDYATPIIQVAGDGKTAKALFSALGLETPHDKDGNPVSLWAWHKVRYDFIKEDGQWRIWHQTWYTTFNTSFSKSGWTEEPMWAGYYDIPVDFDSPDIKPDRPFEGASPYNNTSADFNLHKLIPAPPAPYQTWDED